MTKPRHPTAAGTAHGETDGGALVFVDAVEGDRARLLLGVEAFEVPVRLLPPGTREGNWLRLSLVPGAAPADDDDGAAIRRKLGRDDGGGDIEL